MSPHYPAVTSWDSRGSAPWCVFFSSLRLSGVFVIANGVSSISIFSSTLHNTPRAASFLDHSRSERSTRFGVWGGDRESQMRCTNERPCSGARRHAQVRKWPCPPRERCYGGRGGQGFSFYGSRGQRNWGGGGFCNMTTALSPITSTWEVFCPSLTCWMDARQWTAFAKRKASCTGSRWPFVCKYNKPRVNIFIESGAA